MSKKRKKVITISLLVGCLIAYGLHSCGNKNDNDYSQYMNPDTKYSDSNLEEETFVTFEEIVVNKWYALEIEENGKRDVIITKKTSYDKIPNGTIAYYYKNALSEENKVYLVFYSEADHAISVETGPEIENAICLADYLIDNNLAETYITITKINNVRDVIKEKLDTKKDFNKGDVLIKEPHYY